MIPNAPTRLAAQSEAYVRVYEVRTKVPRKAPHLTCLHVSAFVTVKCRETARRTAMARAEADTLREHRAASAEACTGGQAGTGEETAYSKVR